LAWSNACKYTEHNFRSCESQWAIKETTLQNNSFVTELRVHRTPVNFVYFLWMIHMQYQSKRFDAKFAVFNCNL